MTASMALVMLLPHAGCASADRTPKEVQQTEASAARATPDEESVIELMKPVRLQARLFAPSDKPRLYNFWAMWCGPCRAEMPRLRDWAGEHPRFEVVLVNVDLPRLRRTKVEPFVRELDLGGLTHWQVDDRDPASALAQVVPDWGFTLPVTLVVDEQGRITQRFDRALMEADLAGLP